MSLVADAQPKPVRDGKVLANPMENSGKIMWNDTVNANCIRADVYAVKPSNMSFLHRAGRSRFLLFAGRGEVFRSPAGTRFWHLRQRLMAE